MAEAEEQVITRDSVQQAAFEAWVAAEGKGAVLLGTGTGKTRVGIWAAAPHINSWLGDYALSCASLEDKPRILWLTNSETLRDEGTKADFEKWGEGYCWQHIEAECYQTAYKWEGKHFDLVICDEADYALTPEYSRFFQQNTYEQLLLLTATVKEDKRELLSSICPIVYQYSTQQAQQDGLLNQTQVLLLEVDLSQEPTIVRKNHATGQEFRVSEASVYEYWETEFAKQLVVLDKLKQRQWSNQQSGFANQLTDQELEKADKKLQRIIAQRTKCLWESPTLIAAAKLLTRKVLHQENAKVVLFSKRKQTAEALGSNVYHSGNKKGNDAIEKFNNCTCRGLSVVDAVNRGVNLVGADHFIYVGYHSSGVDFQQRHGRGVRLPLDQVGYHLVLLPYYTTKAGLRKPTQAVKWAERMLSEFQYTPSRQMHISNYLKP